MRDEYKLEGFPNQVGIVIPFEVKTLLEADELTSLLYVTDVGYYPQAAKHYVSRRSGAQQHILIFCAAGQGWYSLDGERQRVEAGQFFVIGQGTPHSYGASESAPWSIYWLHFTGTQSGVFSDLFDKLHDLPAQDRSRGKERITLFEELFCNLQCGYTKDNLRYTTACLWHLLGSFRYTAQFDEVARADLGDVVQLTSRFMRANIDRTLSLRQIADHAGYSCSHFGKLFLARTNQTPLDYFNHMKVQTACRYLTFSSLKIKDIAARLGFYDQYHFSRVFFKYMNQTPSMYRSRKR